MSGFEEGEAFIERGYIQRIRVRTDIL